MKYKNISIRIHRIRKELGATQKEFAEKIGVTGNYISEIEAKKKIPSVPVLLAIEHVFGVTKEWLLSGKGEKYVQENFPITSKEEEIIKALREMPDKGKKVVIDLIELVSNKKVSKD
ncbi:helix-turn-helix transcriptional regulator [Desulfobacterota bacterium AH_259_B03_O07]|nr:helix-turn-helix transcriptional regulator [Desulfobacterota bacterium AH_259_B03_O07]